MGVHVLLQDFGQHNNVPAIHWVAYEELGIEGSVKSTVTINTL